MKKLFRITGQFRRPVQVDEEVRATSSDEAYRILVAQLRDKEQDPELVLAKVDMQEITGPRLYACKCESWSGREGDMRHDGDILVVAASRDEARKLIYSHSEEVAYELGAWAELDSLDVNDVRDVTDDPDYANQEAHLKSDGGGILQDEYADEDDEDEEEEE